MSGLPARERTSGIVLAGGIGERYGAGRSKAWLTTGAGDPLLQVALASIVRVAMRAIVAAPLDLSLPAPLPAPNELDEEPGGYAVTRVADLAPGGGPLAGLVPALERATAKDAEFTFILAVDMPRFAPAEFARLYAPFLSAPGALAVVPRTPAGLEPLFSCVRTAPVAAAFRAAWDAGERAVHAAFRTLGPGALIELDTTDPAAWPGGPGRLRSINVPEDLRSVLAEDRSGT